MQSMLQAPGLFLRGSGQSDVSEFGAPFEIDIKEHIHCTVARIRLKLWLNRRHKEPGAMEEGEHIGFCFLYPFRAIGLLRSIVRNLQQAVVRKDLACIAKVVDAEIHCRLKDKQHLQ